MTRLNERDRRRLASLAGDSRWARLVTGLDQLPTSGLCLLAAELQSGTVLFDSGNFDPISGLWCPLAVGLGLPTRPEAALCRSNADGKAFLEAAGSACIDGFSVNPLSGVKGESYTTERPADLRLALKALLAYRLHNRNRNAAWTAAELADLAAA